MHNAPANVSTRLHSSGNSSRRLLARALAVLLLTWAAFALRAGPIALPNASFEAPATLFVNTLVEAWQKTPKPDWYDESDGFMWDQLTGVFLNPAATSGSRIDNCDGEQALWFFAVPEVGLFQELTGQGASGLDVEFEVGKSYVLTVGVIGGGGGMFEGATLESSFYYRDDEGNAVTVASTSITNTATVFSNTTHLIDFQVRVPTVNTDDAWADQTMGVRFLSTVSFDLQAGYWDLDNVRLTSVAPPILVDVTESDRQFRFMVESEPGLEFELLASSDPALPTAEWTRVVTLTNVTGRVEFSEPATNSVGRVYQARQME